MRFYSSVRIAMQRGAVVRDSLGAAGATVKVTTVKNKVAPPLRECELPLRYGHGFIEERQDRPAAQRPS